MSGAAGGPEVVEARLERAIDDLLAARRPEASICPSEAARVVDPEGWRALMPVARSVAGRMAAEGRVQVTQRGEPVDLTAGVRGPVRIRRPAGGGRVAGPAGQSLAEPAGSATSFVPGAESPVDPPPAPGSGERTALIPASEAAGSRPSSASRVYR